VSGHPVVASWDRPFFYVSDLNAYPSTTAPRPRSPRAGHGLCIVEPDLCRGDRDWWGIEESGYSTDGGQTWHAFPTELPGGGQSFVGGRSQRARRPTLYGRLQASTLHLTRWMEARRGTPSLSRRFQLEWFDSAYYFNTRTVTADRVLPNTFYLYYAGSGGPDGVYETTNAGPRGLKYLTDKFRRTPTSMQRSNLSRPSRQSLFTGDRCRRLPSSRGRLFSVNQWRSNVDRCSQCARVSTFGFGAPATPGGYPSIYIVGYVNNVYGIWQSNDDAHSWVQIGTYRRQP